MGTRATVKFFNNEELVLSVYHQYDGYQTGVGEQIRQLVEQYQIVNGLYGGTGKIANGIDDLALLYILDNKESAGGIYAASKNDTQEYDYEVYARHDKSLGVDVIYKIVMIDNYEDKRFEGSKEEFNDYILDCGYEG